MRTVSIGTLLLLAVLILIRTFSFLGCACAQSGDPPSQLRPIQLDGKWGYIDHTGKVVIKPQFVWAEEFSEGLAAFENEDGKHGYIDESGTIGQPSGIGRKKKSA